MTYIPNLLAFKSAFNRVVKYSLIGIILISFFSCNESSELGLGTLPSGDKGSVLFTEYSDDDITITNLLLDSVFSPTGAVFMGKMQDPELGTITMEGYMGLRTNANLSTFPADAILDSTQLRFGLDSQYGDSTAQQKIYVHMLSDTLPIKNFYLFEKRAYEPIPVDTFSIRIADGYNKGYYYKRVDGLGRKIFNAGSAVLTSIENFNLTMKGVAFVPDNANSSLFSFDTDVSSQIECFYHTATDSTKKSLTFLFNTDNIHCSYFKADLIGALASLSKYGDTLSTAATGGKFYIHSFRGIRSLFRLPVLDKIKKDLNGRIISKAELIITPLNYDFPYITHRGIVGGIHDGNYRFSKSSTGNNYYVYSDLQITAGYTQGADLNSFYSFYPNSSNVWEMNITTYVNQIINGKRSNTGFIMFPFSFSSEGVRRTVFASGEHPNQSIRPRLRVYYLNP